MRRFLAVMWVVLGMTNTIPAQAEPAPREASTPGKTPAATDCHGDPLPEGAIARLGTVRFRLGYGAHVSVRELNFGNSRVVHTALVRA
jgi:hypothetical protein